MVAASTTLLAGSKSGRRSGFLPRELLVMDSIASLAANEAGGRANPAKSATL